jgi:hypothetical protein
MAFDRRIDSYIDKMSTSDYWVLPRPAGQPDQSGWDQQFKLATSTRRNPDKPGQQSLIIFCQAASGSLDGGRGLLRTGLWHRWPPPDNPQQAPALVIVDFPHPQAFGHRAVSAVSTRRKSARLGLLIAQGRWAIRQPARQGAGEQ